MLPLLMMLRLLVTVPPSSFVRMPEVGKVIVPDDVIVPVLSNVFVVVRMPVGPIVMVPELATGPLFVMVPKSVIRPLLLRVTLEAITSVLPEIIVRVETVHVELASVQVPAN